MVIKHEQNAGYHQDEKGGERERPEKPGGLEFESTRANLHREKVQEDVLLDRFGSMQMVGAMALCLHKFLDFQRGRAVYHQIPVVRQPHLEPREGLRGWSCDLDAIPVEATAMTRASNQVQLRLPRGQASQMRTDSSQGVIPLGAVHQVDSALRVQRDRVRRKLVGLAGFDDGRSLKQNVGRKILVSEQSGADSGHNQVAQAELGEEVPAGTISALAVLVGGRTLGRMGRRFLLVIAHVALLRSND